MCSRIAQFGTLLNSSSAKGIKQEFILGHDLSSDLAVVGVVAEDKNRKKEIAFYNLSVTSFFFDCSRIRSKQCLMYL